MAEKFKPCCVENCKGNAHWTKKGIGGMCRSHWRRLQTHGDPNGGRPRNGETKRFYREVVLTCTDNDCLIWPYARNNGYGIMNFGGKAKTVHRLACIEVHGNPPTPDHQAAHNCGNGSSGCVNPQHLEWKTPAENQADKVIHETDNRGERCAASKLTTAQVREIRALKGRMTQTQIGEIYGVNYITIGDIHNRRTWAWLE